MESQNLNLNVAGSFSSIGLLDELIKEYLLFRGFASSLKSFESELKSDKEKSFRPDKITDMLLAYIHQYDLANLLDLWTFLEQKYFTRISLKFGSAHAISRKYELFLFRYYLVHAVQTNKLDKAFEFFENYVSKVHSQNEWKEWFCLPFTKNPQDSAQFSIYFNKNWIDTFMISLQNFLAIIFQSLQLPRLLNYEEDAFWSKCLKSPANSTDYDYFEQDYLQSELNDEFEFKSQDFTNKSTGGLIGLFKNLKNNKLTKNKETKNLSQIATDLISNDSNFENSYEKLSMKSDNTQEKNEIEKQPYVTLNQEDLNEHKSAIVLIKISYDLKFFASVDMDGIIKVWSIENPLSRLVTTVSKSYVQTIEWDKLNSNILYIGSKQNSLKVYDLSIKKIVQELVLNKQYPLVKLVVSTSSNKLIVVQLRDIDKSSQVVLFEFSKNLNQLKSTLFDFFQITNCVEFVQEQLILACSDGFVRLFDLNKQEISLAQRCHNEPILGIKINQDNNLLVTTTHDQIYIWNIEDQFELDFSQKIENFSNDENFLSLEPNQSILFALDQTGCNLISLKKPNTLISLDYQLENSIAFNLQSSNHMSVLALGNQSEMYSLSRYMIDINIETLAGTTFSLKVSPHESVQSVKAKIQRHEGIPISHQHLIWQSNELEDKCSLNDYSIPNGATIRMVIAIRGGPINTRRMTTEDALLRDVSDLMEIHDDSTLWNSDSHSNKHVTLLLFRDGDHLNLLRVIDRGEANSPVSGAMSAASMYVPYDEADHDTISLANNLEDILSGATFGSTTDLNSQKSISTRPKQLKLLSKRKKSSNTDNLKTKEKMLLIKQKLKLKSDKIAESKNQSTVENDSVKRKNRSNKKSASVQNLNKENEENGEIEANEVDDDELSDDEYADEYLDDDEDYDEDDDDEEDYDDEEEDHHYYPNLSHSSENNHNNNLDAEFAPDDEDYDDEDELILNKSECLLNEDQQPSASPTQNRIPSSLATTALPTLNTPTDTEHLQTPYSGRINKNGLLSSKLEYIKNRRKVDSKVPKGENEEDLEQETKTIRIRRRKEDDSKSTRKRRSKRYEIASFSPTTIYVKTVNLERKKSMPKLTTDNSEKDRIVSSSNKKVSFSVNDDKTDLKLNSKKPLSKFDSLYTNKSNIEETITNLPDKKPNQLNPILKSANRLEMLKTNLTSSASILKPYQPNPILAPVMDKTSDRIYSAAKQKQLSLSANDLVQSSKSSIKLPPVVTSTSVQSANDANILIAGSSNNLNSIGLNEVKKKVTDLSRYCYYCKKKTGLASSYMCRCGNNYCTQHRNAEAHSCTYDYKTEGRKLIEQSNPLVAAPKLPKI